MPGTEERYSTISVPASTKATLQAAKGNMEWGPFLLSLYEECLRLKRAKSHEALKSMLSGEDLENAKRSSDEFRRSFKLRSQRPGA